MSITLDAHEKTVEYHGSAYTIRIMSVTHDFKAYTSK